MGEVWLVVRSVVKREGREGEAADISVAISNVFLYGVLLWKFISIEYDLRWSVSLYIRTVYSKNFNY